MPSLLPGYSYDIFISYRHNDNLDGTSAGSGQGWVTEFVEALERELKATLKEPLSIYFDKNPHDGLLETHHVDKSLEGKLKCLIFIPILSQTYCDARSFAWQHEFCAFNKLAQADALGRDIKLGNGNVASRILPVMIHDLDADDKRMIEGEIGGVLRGIEFIYKEPGVNRPLRPADQRNENLNRTDYRNQLNKLAQAVKEIVTAVKQKSAEPAGAQSATTQPAPAPRKAAPKRWVAALIAVVVLAGAAALFFTFYSNNEPLDKSIAVLPFADLSPDKDQEYFGDGIAEEIINVLAQVEGLKVISRSSSFQFKGKNPDLREVGTLLGVATVLEGSIRRSGDRIRITAQLIKTSDGSHVWSKNYDKNVSDVIQLEDEIAQAIATSLRATLALNPTKREVWDEEAWKDYQQGRYFFDRNAPGDHDKSMEYFQRSVKKDSTHAITWAYLTIARTNFAQDSALFNRINNRALQLDSLCGDAWVNKSLYAMSYQGNHTAAYRYIQRALQCPENPRILRNVGNIMNGLGFPKEGIPYIKRAIQLDPLQSRAYDYLSTSYFACGQYDSALIAVRKGININNDRGRASLMDALIMSGQFNEALKEVGALADTVSQMYYVVLIQHNNGNKAYADAMMQRLQEIAESGNPYAYYLLASANSFRGEKEKAIQFLQKSAASSDKTCAWSLKTDPFMEPLRDDPRFQKIVSSLGVVVR